MLSLYFLSCFFSELQSALQTQHSPVAAQPAVFSLVFLQADKQLAQKCYAKAKTKTEFHG